MFAGLSKWRHALTLTVLTLATAAGAGQPRPVIPSPDPAPLKMFDDAFDLERPADLLRLAQTLESEIERSRREAAAWKTDRDLRLANRPLTALSQVELIGHYHPPPGLLEKKEIRGLREIGVRLKAMINGADAGTAGRLRREVRELAAALQNHRRDPVPRTDLFTVPFIAIDFLRNPIGLGHQPAANLAGCSAADPACDPAPSSFWDSRRSIEDQELYHGFGREQVSDWASMVWEYAGPKTSTGGNPGFEVRHGDVEAKVKFAETWSEPLTARLFHALGYHVEPTDHVRQLRVRYDRRILREFNLRRDIRFQVRIIGPPVHTFSLQKRHDPLASIAGAVLRDGATLETGELRRRLFLNPNLPEPEIDPKNFDADFEAMIEHLVMEPANFQPDQPNAKSIGPWDYGQLGHEHLREVRGAGLLAAWLGWFDCRFDNTRLQTARLSDGSAALRHVFTDLGGGLGRSDWGFNWLSENLDALPWEFTRPAIRRGPGRMTTPFRVVRFHTITDNTAFRAMTEDDARWMGRRIARLSASQLMDAVVASGLETWRARLCYAKLAARRNKLLQDLDLSGEFPPLPTGMVQSDVSSDVIAGERSPKLLVEIERAGRTGSADTYGRQGRKLRQTENPGTDVSGSIAAGDAK